MSAFNKSPWQPAPEGAWQRTALAAQRGPLFAVFALVLFAALCALGLSFQRAVPAAREDLVYARGINRIRHFDGEVASPLTDDAPLGAEAHPL